MRLVAFSACELVWHVQPMRLAVCTICAICAACVAYMAYVLNAACETYAACAICVACSALAGNVLKSQNFISYISSYVSYIYLCLAVENYLKFNYIFMIF